MSQDSQSEFNASEDENPLVSSGHSPCSIDNKLTGKSKVLNASVNDVRYFAALLRGINFANVSLSCDSHVARNLICTDVWPQRATVTLTKSGLIVNVEDARTLLG